MTTESAAGSDPDEHGRLMLPRRQFLMVAGASVGAASLAACGGGASAEPTAPAPSPTPAPSPSPAPAPTPAPAPAPGVAITSFTLTSAVAGSAVPFAIGQPLRKGDVPAGRSLVVDGVAAQVLPISTWDDGSAKHVVVAGRASMTANVARSFALKIGTPTAGTSLTEADLISAGPTASVSYGSYGSVSLTNLLGTNALVLSEQAGPHYAAFQYIGAFPNDSSVRAVFYVQLWSDRQYRIRVAIENGTSPGTASAKSGTAVVSIAGSQRHNAAVSMPWATRWDVVGTSGSDPAIVPAHDAAYLRATRLVPNYGWTNVDAGTVSGLQTSYTPMERLGWTQNMGDTGFQFSIGLLPHWDAVYCCTAAAQAYRAVIAHGRSFGCYSIFYRHASTRRMPKPTDHPNAFNTYDSSGSESYTGSGTNSNRWEIAHCPNAGYLPWLLTAERCFLEVLQANAWAYWMSGSTSEAAGTAREWSSQTRARGWRFRSIACAAAVSPNGDAAKTDWIANTAAMIADPYTRNVTPNTPATGLVGTWSDLEPGTAGFQISIFESMIVSQAIAFAWDIEPGLGSTAKAQHLALRDHVHKGPVGLLGRGPANGEFSWRRAPGPYRMVIGADSNLTSLYDNWSQVYAATYGDNLDSGNGLSIQEAYADDPSNTAFPEGAWGFVITAAAYAVDHGASGAAAAWARLTSASNWTSNSAKFVYRPQYGVVPRS